VEVEVSSDSSTANHPAQVLSQNLDRCIAPSSIDPRPGFTPRVQLKGALPSPRVQLEALTRAPHARPNAEHAIVSLKRRSGLTVNTSLRSRSHSAGSVTPVTSVAPSTFWTCHRSFVEAWTSFLNKSQSAACVCVSRSQEDANGEDVEDGVTYVADTDNTKSH